MRRLPAHNEPLTLEDIPALLVWGAVYSLTGIIASLAVVGVQ